MSFDRISSDRPIRVRAGIEKPDIVVVLDPSLLRIGNVTSGLKEGGTLIINSARPLDKLAAEYGERWKLAVVDAGEIARDLLGVPIVNTTMIGALLKTTSLVKLESMIQPLKDRFGRLAERNVNAMKKAYEETQIREAG